MMKPPSGGPMIGAERAGQVSVAMARIRSALEVLLSTTSRPTGTIMAPPMPCRTRDSVKLTTPVEMAQSTEAMVKTATADAKTLRAPKRSAIQPLAGMKIASASI